MSKIRLALIILFLNIIASNSYAKTTYTVCHDCDIQQQSLMATQIPLLSNQDTVFVFDEINRTVNEFKIVQYEGEEIPGTNIPRIFSIANLAIKSEEVYQLQVAYADVIEKLGENGHNLYDNAEILPDDFIIPSAADIVMNPNQTQYIASYFNNYLNKQTDIIKALSHLEIQLRNLNISVPYFGNIMPTNNVFYVKFPDDSLARVKITLVKVGTQFEVSITYDNKAVMADGTEIPMSALGFTNLMIKASQINLPSLTRLATTLGVSIVFPKSCNLDQQQRWDCNDKGVCTITC